MIIIIEGIDRVGKTTLANKIKEEINIPCFKSLATKQQIDRINNEDETMKSINTIRLCNLLHGDIVIDRFHWSDLVYGRIERNYDILKSEENWNMIENELKNQKALIIFVKPTDIEMSSKKHGKNLYEYEMIFEDLYIKSNNNKISCDFYSFDSVIKYIRKIFTKED